MSYNKNIFHEIDHYKVLFQDAYDPMAVMQGDHFIDCNQAVLDILQMSTKKELYRVHPSQISPEFQPDGKRSDEKANEMMRKCHQNGVHRFDWVHTKLNDEEFWVEVTLTRVNVNDEYIIYVIWKDIQERIRYTDDLKEKNRVLYEKNVFIKELNLILQKEDKINEHLSDSLLLLEEYKKVIDESAIVSKTDIDGNITYVNDLFCQASGYTKKELLGKNHNIIRHPNNPPSLYKDLWEKISNKKLYKGILRNRRKDGSTYYVDATIMPILDKDNTIMEYIAVRYNITSLYEKDELIYRQFTDKLTSLPNRQKLLNDMDTVLKPNLAIININRFKDINESYGLDLGDELLKQIANELLLFRSTNLNTYRIGGDVFALLSYGNVSLDELERLCFIIIEHIQRKEFIIRDNRLHISCTLGIASDDKNILSHAEMALDYAKQHNRDIVTFDEQIDISKTIKENINRIQDIKYALKNDKILLYGQKILSTKTAEEKYEVLIRVQLENGIILAPSYFLELAKKARLYPQMTKAMIEKSCHYFKGKGVCFSINLTIQDILDPTTVEFLIEKLQGSNLTKFAILEIVESEGIEMFHDVSNFIKKLKAIGCKIAIDDFGTGYSNFEYLIKLDIDILKIDGSLIRNIDTDQNMFTTVSAIVNFAKALHIDIVAEYVHSKEVYDVVRSLDIDYAQGYFLHEPEHLT